MRGRETHRETQRTHTATGEAHQGRLFASKEPVECEKLARGFVRVWTACVRSACVLRAYCVRSFGEGGTT